MIEELIEKFKQKTKEQLETKINLKLKDDFQCSALKESNIFLNKQLNNSDIDSFFLQCKKKIYDAFQINQTNWNIDIINTSFSLIYHSLLTFKIKYKKKVLILGYHNNHSKDFDEYLWFP